MALKDRLDQRRRPDPAPEGSLSVITGDVREPQSSPAPSTPTPVTETDAAKGGRLAPNLSTAKTAIHALLVERHAHEIDITDREGVRSRLALLTEEYVKNAGLSFNRLDYVHLVEALLDEVLGLGPLEPLL